MNGLSILPVEGVGEVRAGDDLAALLVGAIGRDGLADGDVLVVTSKVVSKAEGRSVTGDRSVAIDDETDREVARRGGTVIVRTHHGLVLAGAGIDASNTGPGTVLLLPRDPDASARGIREALASSTGRNVAVVVSDTAGRAWRHGQADLAIGAAGLIVLDDHAGRTDDYGNTLTVTAPAVADEVAAAADLVKGKLARRPAAVLRGLEDLVLPRGEHGPGAQALVRAEDEDMFGYGARDAVLHAVGGSSEDRRGFGRSASHDEAAARLAEVAAAAVDSRGDALVVQLPEEPRAAGRLEARMAAVAFALGWQQVEGPGADSPTLLRFRPATP
jgi:coenzyme F420-0:L-glutamate ligase/coenzyme F420-1:gamma-L-glutamate ligase